MSVEVVDEGANGCMPFLPRCFAVSRWRAGIAARRSSSALNLKLSSQSTVGSHSDVQSSNLDEVDDPPTVLPYVRDEEITIRILEVTSSHDTVAVNAAGCLFEKAHVSNPRHEQNKAQMGAEGAISALGNLLSLSRIEIARYHACSALSELAFEHPLNCLAIVSTPGMLKSLVVLLQPSSGGTQEDAARIINNCAAFCEQAIALIVQCPGMIKALTTLTLRGDMDAKHIAVGALNSLSRCYLAKAKLLKSDALTALSLVLEEGGDDERQTATHASAAMAMASLTGDKQSLDSHAVCSSRRSRYRQSIQKVVELFDFSIHRKQWAGILFRPYSILYPLHQLSCNPANRARLVEFGILERMRTFLGLWHDCPRPKRALELAIRIIQNLGACDEYKQLIREEGLVESLERIAAHEASPASCRRRAADVVEDLAQGAVAVMMGQHRRLGAASPLMALDEATAALILRMAFGPKEVHVVVDAADADGA